MCAALPTANLQRQQQRRLQVLTAVLNDTRGCSKVSKETILQLARSSLALNHVLCAATHPMLVATCSNSDCDARLVVFRSRQESHLVNEMLMQVPSLGPAMAYKELSALEGTTCKCGGQFILRHNQENNERSLFLRLR